MERFRIEQGVDIYFVTFSVVEWLPVFITQEACLVITDSLNFCHEHKGLRINAVVIMPTHMHAILFDAEGDAGSLKEALQAFRSFTAHKLVDYCQRNMPSCFCAQFSAAGRKDDVRRFWQPTQHPEGITSEKFHRQKVDYIHDNPRRKGLVRDAVDWRFSSAGFWLEERPSDVTLTAIEW